MDIQISNEGANKRTRERRQRRKESKAKRSIAATQQQNGEYQPLSKKQFDYIGNKLGWPSNS